MYTLDEFLRFARQNGFPVSIELKEPTLATVPSKSRKQAAVTKTSNRATIKLIQSNVIKSPLLSLPTELLIKILTYLIGDRCVHLKLKWLVHPRWGNDCWDLGSLSKDRRYHHAVCQVVRARPVGMFRTATIDSEARDSPMIRHRSCIGDGSSCEPSDKLDLSVLCTCRQIYAVAHSILWASNTFVFNDRATLMTFADDLNTAQRQKLNHVHIGAKIYFMDRDDLRNARRSRKAIATGTANVVQHVEHIDLDIRYNWNNSRAETEVALAAVECFMPLQVLRLKQATLHLERDRSFHQNPHFRNPTIQKIEREALSALLAPDGLELAKTARKPPKHFCTEAAIYGEYQKRTLYCNRILEQNEKKVREHDEHEKSVQEYLESKKASRDQLKALNFVMERKAGSLLKARNEAEKSTQTWKEIQGKRREERDKRLEKLRRVRESSNSD